MNCSMCRLSPAGYDRKCVLNRGKPQNGCFPLVSVLTPKRVLSEKACFYVKAGPEILPAGHKQIWFFSYVAVSQLGSGKLTWPTRSILKSQSLSRLLPPYEVRLHWLGMVQHKPYAGRSQRRRRFCRLFTGVFPCRGVLHRSHLPQLPVDCLFRGHPFGVVSREIYFVAPQI